MIITQPLPKEILAKRSGKLRSPRMMIAVKTPYSAETRRRMGIFLTETPPIGSLKHLFRPLFPPHPPFFRPPVQPTAGSGASHQKQIPNSQTAFGDKASLVAAGVICMMAAELPDQGRF